jgi:hypothetical protein
MMCFAIACSACGPRHFLYINNDGIYVVNKGYKNKLADSSHFLYNDSGDIYMESIYKNGNIIKQYRYNQNANDSLMVKYAVDFDKEGMQSYYIYFKTGELYSKGNYKYCPGIIVTYVDSVSRGDSIGYGEDLQFIETGTWKTYYKNGQLKYTENYAPYYLQYKTYESDTSGNFYIIQTTLPTKNGKFEYYTEDGRLYKYEIWENGYLIETQVFNDN